jgi:hypothetical protein
VFVSLCSVALRWILQLAVLRVRSNDFKDLEIVVLRHELAILRRRSRRPAMAWADRLCLTAASRLLSRGPWRAFIRHACDAAAVASAPDGEAVDVRASSGSSADSV